MCSSKHSVRASAKITLNGTFNDCVFFLCFPLNNLTGCKYWFGYALDNGHRMDLRLHQTPKLIDDAFIFIRRFANTSQFIEDSHKLAERYQRCFYRNEISALDLCDNETVVCEIKFFLNRMFFINLITARSISSQ